MKKSLLFIMSVAMLAAFGCSDDDKSSWEELPSTPITGADAMIVFNGERSYGSVQLQARNSSGGVLDVVNVIPGYPEVTMDVEIAEQIDGTFNVAGTTTLDNPPCMLPSSKADGGTGLYNLSVEGKITKEGKADMEFSAVLTDKAQGRITGKWELTDYLPLTPEGMENAPVQVQWITTDMGAEADTKLSAMASLIAGNVVYQMLKSVTFAADGNIRAEYSSNFDLAAFMGAGIDKERGRYVHVGNDWKESPRNLAFWFTMDGCMYVTPYLPNIMAQIAIDNGENPDLNNGALPEMEKLLLEKLASLGVDVSLLMEQFNEWNEHGISIEIDSRSNDSMKLVLTGEALAPVVKAFIPALDKLDEKIAEMIAANPDDATVKMLMTEIMPALGINKMSDLGEILSNHTKSFTVSLDLVRVTE